MTKLIDGFSNYTISTDGVVTNIKTNQIKKPWLGKVGYYYLDLYENNKSTKVALHRLLAQTFIPNPENKRTVNHIDGNKLNNSLTNLEWATDSENTKHAFDTGLNYCKTKKISDEALDEILNRFFAGESLTDIVKDYEFSLPTVSTYIEQYTISTGVNEAFIAEKQRQKNIRAAKAGSNKRNKITLQMIDKSTNEILNTFESVTEAKQFLNTKSCGPISNVLAGRQKSAYGYYWKKI